MKCHYEVLEVSMTASVSDIRYAYRQLALKWHPDKNLDNEEVAKEQFQLIQQAYEVLSDPQERAWYDKHRDSILKGGKGSDYTDDSLNVYEYFTTTCFSGFGDDPKSFYSVYSEVFKKIAAEDSEFDKNLDSDCEIPVFGDAHSSYDEVVYPFYAHWQSYSTKKTYSWLDEYDIRQAPNRRIVRLMEKENKKIRDKARKERNEEVRALVAFVRKRDKRVIEHIKKLEEEALERERKLQDARRQQILKRRTELKSYVETDWSKFSNLEGELKEIEANLAAEFQDDEDRETSSNEDEELYNNFFCVACSKIFKTAKAFSNHENSKKHRDNVEALRIEMDEDEISVESDCDDEGWKEELKGKTGFPNDNVDAVDSVCTEGVSVRSSGNSILEDSEVELTKPKKKKKQKQKKRFMMPPESDLSDDSLQRNIYRNSDDENLAPIREKNQVKIPDDLIESDITENEISDSIQEDLKTGKVRNEKKKKSKQRKVFDTFESSETDLLVLESQGKRRNKKVFDNDGDDELSGKSKKKTKRKDLKSVKKADSLEKTSQNNTAEMNSLDVTETKVEIKCELCSVPFPSKNELFKHLKETGHAVAKGSDTTNTKLKKPKK